MSMERHDSILRVEGLGLTLGQNEILRQVNFDLKDLKHPSRVQGQVASIIGRSGIGKSQLFRCMAGLQKPTVGQVIITRDGLHREVLPGEVGVVPQNYILFGHRTVKSNLDLAVAQAFDKVKAKEALANGVELFGLTQHLDKYPKRLSGGQRQRVSILQQIVAGNSIILMDEPFSGLDVIVLDKVISVIHKVAMMDELNTIVLVSHDIESSLSISDYAIVLAPTQEGPASVRETIDLVELGLEYADGIRDNPRFRELVGHVRSIL